MHERFLASGNTGHMELIDSKNYPADIQVAVRTLTVGGFTLEKAARHPSFASIYTYRYDEFAVKQQYCFAIFNNPPTENEISSARISAEHQKYELVVISPAIIPGVASIEWERFLNLFGGPIYSYSPLDREFGEQLEQLGLNKLPPGLVGKPDDLFELYIHQALQFIFGCKIHRYGQERRFETCPDGAILKDKAFAALYDTKAYSNGFETDASSMRQFGSYVTDFQHRYSSIFDLNAFIVISGKFPSSVGVLESRSRQLLSEGRVPLVFLTAKTIVEIIGLLSEFPAARHSINWKRVFVNPVVSSNLVQVELKSISNDQIVSKTGR